MHRVEYWRGVFLTLERIFGMVSLKHSNELYISKILNKLSDLTDFYFYFPSPSYVI